MRWRSVQPFAIAACAFALVAACGSRSEGLDASRLPDHVRGDYQVFARKCSKCHSLARPLQSGIKDDEQWVLYVNRMRRQQGSGISLQDQEVILRFLRYYAAEQRRIEAEKHAGMVPTPVPAPAATSTTGPIDGGGS